MTLTEAKSQPFHVYDPEFYAIIGPNPKLSRVFSNPDYAGAHEAAVYDEPTNTLFFAANAGGPKGFSGLNSTNRVFRMNVTEAERAASTATLNADDGDYVGGNVTLHQIPSVNLENVNGGAKYNGQIAFMTEGRGDNLASQITLVNPMEPYNSTVLLNNFFGRQFNSLNDAAYHRATGDLFFTDVDYGYIQSFRPSPGLPNQIYRYNQTNGLVSVVADGFVAVNGICFSPDQRTAYVTDTGLFGLDRNPTRPSTIYAYDVSEYGTFSGRRTFAYVNTGIPDGVHTDTNGNVWMGDGIAVYNSLGRVIGKIFVGSTSANFAWGGDGKLFILAETKVYLAEIAAKGDPVWRN